MKKFIKKNWSTILLVIMFTVGLSLLLYPSIADWWNKFHATRAIDSYTETVASMSDEEYQKYLSEAKLYNSELLLSRIDSILRTLCILCMNRH